MSVTQFLCMPPLALSLAVCRLGVACESCIVSPGPFQCSGTVVCSTLVATFRHGHPDHLHTPWGGRTLPTCPGLAAGQPQQLEVSLFS